MDKKKGIWLMLCVLLCGTVRLWALPAHEALVAGTPVADTLLLEGCDSVWACSHWWHHDTVVADTATWVVRVHPSYRHTDTVSVCDQYTWAENGTTYYSASLPSVARTTVHGCDSLCALHLTVRHSTPSSASFSACDSAMWEGLWFVFPPLSPAYELVVDTTLALTNAQGCDASKHLTLTLHHSHLVEDTLTICDQYHWDITNTTYFETGRYSHSYPTAHHCDSVRALNLTVVRSYIHEEWADLCEGDTFYFYGQPLTRGGSYNVNHISAAWPFCDSIDIVILNEIQRPEVSLRTYYDCATLTQFVEASANVDYLLWSSDQNNNELDQQNHYKVIAVQPTVPTLYVLFADYHSYLTCPTTDSIVLQPMSVPEAALEVVPAVLTPAHPDFVARDRSRNGKWREWWVDHSLYGYGETLRYATDFSADTLHIQLVSHNDFCTDTCDTIVRIVNETLYVPNAIVPGQEANGLFTIQGDGIQQFQIDIVDRHGFHVFHSNSMNQSWDGTSQGVALPAGSYTYVILYSTEAQPKTLLRKKGSVLLVR